MALSKRQAAGLNKIIAVAQKMLATAETDSPRPSSNNGVKRRRRNSHEAQKMRAEILAKRARGIPVQQLAAKYGVSTAYIYMIK